MQLLGELAVLLLDLVRAGALGDAENLIGIAHRWLRSPKIKGATAARRPDNRALNLVVQLTTFQLPSGWRQAVP